MEVVTDSGNSLLRFSKLDGINMSGGSTLTGYLTVNACTISDNLSDGINASSSSSATYDISVTDSAIQNNGGNGIYLDAGSSEIAHLAVSGSTIADNTLHGIYTRSSTATTFDISVTGSSILNNGDYGIYNDDTNSIVSAENNWWGDSSGPDPYGTGNGINYHTVYDSTCDCRIIDHFYVDVVPWVGMESNYGADIPWVNYAGEPVNTANGNYVYQHTD
ncbi:MAG: right-handed parallel beta-helix repeat-containing protein, partial [Anaerolineaceae bacterium]|nr:right-handed parallel beta-helix repeat-containing protein [Anaerolineaceae bacterium]